MNIRQIESSNMDIGQNENRNTDIEQNENRNMNIEQDETCNMDIRQNETCNMNIEQDETCNMDIGQNLNRNMSINWTVRIKNKTFWLSLIPAVLLLIQVTSSVFGVTLQIDGLSSKLIDVVNALFTVLAILGIVVDPTTYGIGDSDNAMTYTNPQK